MCILLCILYMVKNHITIRLTTSGLVLDQVQRVLSLESIARGWQHEQNKQNKQNNSNKYKRPPHLVDV